jgi:hypothetical protein
MCPDNASSPALVPPAPRLHGDLRVLLKMFTSEAIAIRFVCSTKVAVALYDFGDAGEVIGMRSCGRSVMPVMWMHRP